MSGEEIRDAKDVDERLSSLVASTKDLADSTSDATLVRDVLLLMQEAVRIIGPIESLSSKELMLPEDWPDRPVEERRHYAHAFLVLSTGRDYVDDGWQMLEGAHDLAANSINYLQKQQEAVQAKDHYDQQVKAESLRANIATYQTRIRDLEQRRTKILGTELEGPNLADPEHHREKDLLNLQIELGKINLQATEAAHESFDNPEFFERLSKFYRDYYEDLSKDLGIVLQGRKAAGRRRRFRAISRASLAIVTAIVLYVLGKYSDDLRTIYAIVAAIGIWAIDTYLLEPGLRQLSAKFQREGLIKDIQAVSSVKIHIRHAQAIYNHELRAIGAKEMVLIPVRANSTWNEQASLNVE